MEKRYAAIWFPYLITDWLVLRKPAMKDKAFVFTTSDRGRMIVKQVSHMARSAGIRNGSSLADAKAIVPALEVFTEKPGREQILLRAIGAWCIRYSPWVAVDLPDGLLIDISGCPHLWGGEGKYLEEIVSRLRSKGYEVRAGIADTIGTAWAVARYGKSSTVVNPGEQTNALLPLSPAGLRLDETILQRLRKLGLHQINSFIHMPASVLRRRFGTTLLSRLGQAMGTIEETLIPIKIASPFEERLPCLDPIRTAHGIGIAIHKLLELLCRRLHLEGKGLRIAILRCYRVDGKLITVEIGTNAPTHHIPHLMKLFDLKIPEIEPALGIELFVLDAPKTEDILPGQEAMWETGPAKNTRAVSELVDRINMKIKHVQIHSFVPAEHFWPERSYRSTGTVLATDVPQWTNNRPRPTQLLPRPEVIQVSAPIPDYPPMLFIYKGKRHAIRKSDGPERISREWWLEEGEHRDYYFVEDDEGKRYWLFRSGHYSEKKTEWFIHGFFA